MITILHPVNGIRLNNTQNRQLIRKKNRHRKIPL